MSAYTVIKKDGETLVTTVINSNGAKKSGVNPANLQMPGGFSVERVSEVYGPSNEAKSATQVIPANPLPDTVRYSGPTKTAGADADENVLNIDLAASSATVFIMTKK